MQKGTLKDDKEREARHDQVAYEAACEGIVVLQNNGALPLKDKNVALYGSGARRTVKGGTGSGEVNERHSISVEEGLIALGCNVLTKGWPDKFDAYYESQRAAWKADIKQLLKGVSFVEERALREIYLKGFVIAVKEGHPKAVMTSYNKLNGNYTANNVDLLKTHREEWGFDGIVMSDWNVVREGGADAVQAIRAQNDLIMPGERKQIDMLCGAVENGSLSRVELERCAGRIPSIIEENTALPWD